MSIRSIVLVSILMPVAFAQTSASAYEMPYDPYPWCAVYGGDAGGASNCGFLTIQQCRETISGMGGFCEPNQFYNPHPATSRAHKRKAQG